MSKKLNVKIAGLVEDMEDEQKRALIGMIEAFVNNEKEDEDGEDEEENDEDENDEDEDGEDEEENDEDENDEDGEDDGDDEEEDDVPVRRKVKPSTKKPAAKVSTKKPAAKVSTKKPVEKTAPDLNDFVEENLSKKQKKQAARIVKLANMDNSLAKAKKLAAKHEVEVSLPRGRASDEKKAAAAYVAIANSGVVL